MKRQPVGVWPNGQQLGRILPSNRLDWRIVDAPARHWQRINVLELAATATPKGKPLVAVDRLQFVVPETKP
jgi:hypothetical protein